MNYFYKLSINLRFYILSKLLKKSKQSILNKYDFYLSNNYTYDQNNNKINKIIKKAEMIAKTHILNHKPLAKIFHEKFFFNHKFYTNKYTLDPRPESELLIETAIQLPNINSILDLGTGTGCLAISLSYYIKNVMAIDNNIHCLHVAKKNARNHGRSIKFIRNNWLNNWNQSVDLLVSNPPYLDNMTMNLKHDPKYALIGGIDFYKRIADKSHLFNHILLEINPKYTSQLEQLFPNLQYIDEYIIYINNI